MTELNIQLFAQKYDINLGKVGISTLLVHPRIGAVAESDLGALLKSVSDGTVTFTGAKAILDSK